MVALTLCIPCQYGDHEHHHEVVQVAPEGMLGGARCPCEGDCVDTWTTDTLKALGLAVPWSREPTDG